LRLTNIFTFLRSFFSKPEIVENEIIHMNDVSAQKWRWKYFTPFEIACKGTGLILINEDALDRLDKFREIVNEPFSPNSAFRSEQHNRNIGGSPNSYHLKGMAFDIPIKGRMTREEIHRVALMVGFTGIGDYDTFVHLDTGVKRYWDKRTV